MTTTQSTRPKAWVAPTATMAGALAAAMIPQAADAALVTVGGDGGVGSVTLDGPGTSQNETDLGGLLLAPIRYETILSTYRALAFDRGQGLLYSAVRSSARTPAGPAAAVWTFMTPLSFDPGQGAVFDSSDNWVAGQFRVNGVNDGNLIYGWLQIRLGPRLDEFSPTILSFTYDDEATDATPFMKPVGGFSVPETDPVPEPSTLGLFGLGLGAAFVSRLRRRRRAERDG